jgi:hypothetical protein
MLFAYYINFSPQIFDCYIYIFLNIFFQFHPLEFDFILTLVFIFIIVICFFIIF